MTLLCRPSHGNRAMFRQWSNADRLNFWLTNRIPRYALTRAMRWFSRIESRWLTRAAIAIWQRFAGDLRLEEARQPSFDSLQACFTRRLRDGARPLDSRSGIVTSPCDAVVGAHGRIDGGTLVQAKGMHYALGELLLDTVLTQEFAGGQFATLRLKSSMYHRFHAPYDCRIRHVSYIAGDVWNVNPPALKRVERLFCRNERAVLPLELDEGGRRMLLVPVAAVLVASMRLSFLPFPLDLRYRGANRIGCDAVFEKGDELGCFELGSTMIVLTPPGFAFVEGIEADRIVRMGQALMRKD